MNIAHNILAMNAQRQYGLVTDRKKKSSEKLSSGYRVNRAADDAAGLAISEKMRRQIRGLTQGSRNIQDGISLCQVADGALSDVTDMLHRITELSVQSANGTNSDQDRQYIQEEIQQILTEIDRISDTTTFNEQYLFKGGDIKGGASDSSSSSATSPHATLIVSGTPADNTAREYLIEGNGENGLTLNGETIAWSDWKSSGGNALDINDIKSGTYNCDYHGMKLSMKIKAGMTAEDLTNALSGTSFRTVESSETKKIVSGIQVNSDSPVKVRGTTTIRLEADDEGLAILGGGDSYSFNLKKVSWSEMGIDTSEIKAGDYTHRNPYSKLDFTFHIDEDGISLDDLKKSFDGMEIGVQRIQDQTHYYAVRVGLESPASNPLKSYLVGHTIPYENDISSDMCLWNTANLYTNTEGGITSYIFKPKVEGDKISFVGEKKSNLIPTEVVYTITDESMNALKNYDYSQPSSSTNKNLVLDFEAENGQSMQLYLNNPNGDGSYEDVLRSLTASYNYQVRFSSDLKDYLLIPKGNATAKDVTTSSISLEGETVTIVDTDLPGTVSPEDASEEDGSDEDMSGGVKRWWIQCGAEAGDGLWIETGEMNTRVLGISNLDASTVSGAGDAIVKAKDALHVLMEQRSMIGAEQNRLEHTFNNVMNITENTQDAESRIRDTDMAAEMVDYSTANIISQAGESMMSQANQSKQGILSLLQ